MMQLQVYKFGGTSLGNVERIRRAAELVRACPRPLFVVVSAMAGVTDALIAAAQAAARAALEPETMRSLRARHLDAAAALGMSDRAALEAILDELDALLSATAAIGALSPRSRDRILAAGEKLSARLLAGALRSEGAVAVDADTFLETDDRFGDAAPILGVIEPATRAALRPLLEAGSIPVVTGFCGRARCGSTTTLGRGGSDFSATLLAAALGAREVTIFTDVPGVFSADPRYVPDSRVVAQLNYREAGELSYYGAKVLHPRTIQPLIDPGTPVLIKSSFEPGAPGTRIDATVTAGSHPVKAVSAISGQALLSVEGTGMAGVPGVAARIFSTLAGEGISVTMISQSSAESSVCMSVPTERAAAAEVALRRAFRLDLAHADVEDVRVQTDISLVAVVGLGMRHTPGVSGRLFESLSAAGVNVVAIAQGSSELNITFAVESADCARALRAVHHEFGLHRIDPGRDDRDHFDLILFGFGRIGRALAALVRRRSDAIARRFGATPGVVAVADRSGYLFAPKGLSDEQLERAAAAKEAGSALATLEGAVACDDPRRMLEHVQGYRLARPIFVDLSDADTRALHVAALEHGAYVVTANKRPLAGSSAHYRELTEAVARSGRFLRNEATVGAGLPIVDTLEHMLAAGDRPTRIEGCLSGTLTFLLSELEQGRPFRAALADAERRGYIEPDPWVDLSGEDVLRKAVILGRVAGFELDDERVARSPLVERGRDLAEVEQELAARVRAAQADGRVLRYVATVDARGIEVGLREVERGSPLGNLSGTDNLVLVRSERYDPSPLVISGPGAGVDVTAQGVLTDILRIVAERI